jgi:Mg/Co/Ni transporter MgtE
MALHPADASDRLARLDEQEPDHAVAALFAMKPDLGRDLLRRMDSARARSLLARVHPRWVAQAINADYSMWVAREMQHIAADRMTEIFSYLPGFHPEDAAGCLAVMDPGTALMLLASVHPAHLPRVLQRVKGDVLRQLLPQMAPQLAAVTLKARSADWAAYMLMRELSPQQVAGVIAELGPQELSEVLDAATPAYLAKLIVELDAGHAGQWLDLMPSEQAASVLEALGPRRGATLIEQTELTSAAQWLNQASPGALGKLITALQETPAQLGIELTARLDRRAAGAALAVMAPEQAAPLLHGADSELIAAALEVRAASARGQELARLIEAVGLHPGGLAQLLARADRATAVKIAEAAPPAVAAAALAVMDPDIAAGLLTRLGADDPSWGSLGVPAEVGSYPAKLIDLLRLIAATDAGKASQLAGLADLDARYLPLVLGTQAVPGAGQPR